MKLLLCEDIEKLGYLGDVVEVKLGYARNYLIPQGLAVVPTEEAMQGLEAERAKRANERKMAYEQLEQAAERLVDVEVVVAAKANEQGHLFGSVAEKEIAENLRGQGYEVADKMVAIDEHIKDVGSYDVNVKFTADIAKTIKVIVVAQGEGDSVDESGTEEEN